MRKPPKNALGLLLKSFTKLCRMPENSLFVVDGGYLLRHVIWSQPFTYAGVFQPYISHVQDHYGAQSIVVFDGYIAAQHRQTKQAEHRRRAQTCTSSDIIFEENANYHNSSCISS